MHCPRCGTSATSGQQFCRACGLSLEKVAELLGDELEIESASRASETARLRERQQKFENLAGIVGLTTFGLILLALIVAVVALIILKGGLLIIPGALLILLVGGAFAMGVFQTYSKSLKAKLEQKPLPPSTNTPSIGRPGQIPMLRGSVTERTTELLTQDKDAQTAEITER
jgi:hypothetical protein